jgi:hypothetical protein
MLPSEKIQQQLYKKIQLLERTHISLAWHPGGFYKTFTAKKQRGNNINKHQVILIFLKRQNYMIRYGTVLKNKQTQKISKS